MHELSLCAAIADTATEHAAGRPVERIQLRIGHFRQVVPDTLQFCWTMRNEGTPFEDCALDVDYVPAVVRCDRCAADTTLDAPVLRCGSCDSTQVTLTTGDEFLVVSLDLAHDDPKETP